MLVHTNSFIIIIYYILLLLLPLIIILNLNVNAKILAWLLREAFNISLNIVISINHYTEIKNYWLL